MCVRERETSHRGHMYYTDTRRKFQEAIFWSNVECTDITMILGRNADPSISNPIISDGYYASDVQIPDFV